MQGIGKVETKIFGRIRHADGSVTELGELRSTWRSWPIIRPIRKWFIMLGLRRRMAREKRNGNNRSLD